MGYTLLAAGVGTPMGKFGSYLPKATYPMDIYIMNDLNYESRLGSSGALLISLLNVLHRIRGSKNTAIRELIDKASFIEVEVFGGAGGYYDHSICALGSLRYIRYKNGYESDIEPVPNAMDLARKDIRPTGSLLHR